MFEVLFIPLRPFLLVKTCSKENIWYADIDFERHIPLARTESIQHFTHV